MNSNFPGGRLRGFTLTELLAAFILITIAGALLMPGLAQSNRASNERNACHTLYTVSRANADFRANDRDQNGIPDFWTRDVSGLYTAHPPNSTSKSAIKLIDLSVAAADAENLDSLPSGLRNPGTTSIAQYARSTPKAGYWVYALRGENVDGTVTPYRQITGGSGYAVHNLTSFGFGVFPDSFESGRQLFIVNEANTQFKRQLIESCRARTGNPPGLPSHRGFPDWGCLPSIFPDDEGLKLNYTKFD